MRQRALIKLRAKYLHKMEGGLLMQEGYTEIDGFAASAMDDTTKEFTHWMTQKKELLDYPVFNKHCKNRCTNTIQEINYIFIYDMFINFIDSTKEVFEDFKKFANAVSQSLEKDDLEILDNVCKQIVEEMTQQHKEA